jgi:hypothetical protein
MVRRALLLFAAVAALAALAAPLAFAGSPRADLRPLLVRSGDVPGLDPAAPPFAPKDLGAWLGHLHYEGEEREEVEARLTAEKWVTGVDQSLVARKGSKAEGIEILDAFKSAAGAGAEMRAQLKSDLAPERRRKGETVKFFRVPGLPHAKAFEFVEKGHVWAANVLFTKGPVLVVLGAFDPAGESGSTVTAGAEAILARSQAG